MNASIIQAEGLFEGLNGEELEKVRPLFKERSYPANALVIGEGETGYEMFVLVSGKVRVVKNMVLPGLDAEALGGRDPRKVLAVLDGDTRPFFGEMALVSDCPRSATVETVEPCTFLVTDHGRFFGLVRSEPELGAKLLTALCERLSHMVRSSNAEVMKLTTALALVLAGKR
jgi:CRP-like cAMP-binding protein